MQDTVRGKPSEKVATKPKIKIPLQKGSNDMVEKATSKDNKIFIF